MAHSSLHSVVYISLAVRPFSPAELITLLTRSRARNERAGITGMLLYKSGCFLQAFEGEETDVRALHRRLTKDPRHRNIVMLMSGPITEREFSDWTMGFRHLDDGDVQSQPGFSELLKMFVHHGRCSMDTAHAIKLLRTFTGCPQPARDEHGGGGRASLNDFGLCPTA